MNGNPTCVIIIDTSYLLEFFAVPSFSTPGSIREIRNRFTRAVQQSSRLYVPLPCLFELANHIADVRDGNRRRQLANVLSESVRTSVESSLPWNLVPATGIEAFPQLFDVFAKRYVVQGIGLTDTFLIEEASRLRKEKYRGPGWRIHIWTKDHGLKAREPDREENPFLG